MSLIVVAAAAAILIVRSGDPGQRDDEANPWPAPNQNLASTRAATDSRIDSSSVARLAPAWRFRLRGRPGPSGIHASTPLVAGGLVYVQDLNSSVYALDPADGRPVWRWRRREPNTGPNGLGFDAGTVFGSTDTATFALDAASGEPVWSTRLATPTEQFVQIAPVATDGLVFTATVGFPPGGRGAVYALDAEDGAIAWRFSTIRDPWRHPDLAGGGGVWSPLSVDDSGAVYAGTSNPAPWGGTPRYPDGAAFPGPVPYTSSLLTLDSDSGAILWYDQVTPHDVRDYDFQLSPLLISPDGERDLVVGAGKAGRVIAWDRATHERIWETEVGVHRNDTGPLPRRPSRICPGLLGGVETPMAYADGRVFAPVVDLCVRGSATSYDTLRDLDPASGRGRLVALDAESGERLWERRLPVPAFGCATVAADVVFTVTYDGMVRAFRAADGAPLWRARLRAGSNSCPAVYGDTLLAGAGVVRHPGFAEPVAELVAFRLGG